MPITHSDALRLSTEARDAGDRETAKKYSQIARDLQGRETSGETAVKFYDTKTGRVQHSKAGSDTYVDYMLGESNRYFPVSEQQLKSIREHRQAQPDLFVPSQRVVQDGRELYRTDPGPTSDTLLRTFPGKWSVTYDAGYGEQVKTFDTERQALEFRDSFDTEQKWGVTYDVGSGEQTKTFDTEQQAQGFIESLYVDFKESPEVKRFLGYLKSVGPPTPTDQQRMRSEARIPQIGIPGPALTKPGSPMAKAQDFMDKVLEKTEIPFKTVTNAVRGIETTLDKISHEALRTETGLQPPILLGSQTQPIYAIEDTLRVKTEPKPVVGTAAYLAGVVLAVAAAGVDIATFEIRPGLIAETTGTLIGLGVDAETRGAFISAVAKDPFRFASTLVGGAVLGQGIKQYADKELSIAAKVLEAQRGETVKGLYGTSVKKSSYGDFLKEYKIAKKASSDTLGFDEAFFTKFEREIGLDFPEETLEFRSTQQLFKRGQLNIYDDVGLVEKKLPYYFKTEAEVENLLKRLERGEPDPWSPAQVTKEMESYFALPFDEKGGAILVRGKAGMKPFKEPAALLPPRNEAVAVLTTKLPSMSLKPASLESSFFKTQMIEEAIFHYPSVDLRATLLTAPQVMIPSLFPSSLSISGLLALKSVVKTEKRLRDITKELMLKPQPLKQLLEPKVTQIQIPEVIQAQKPVTTQIQKPKSIQIQIPTITQIQPPIQISELIQKPIQIQIPKIIFPQPPPIIITPLPPPKIPLKVRKKKKKKKKSKRGRKGVYELRVDSIVNKLLKEFKL